MTHCIQSTKLTPREKQKVTFVSLPLPQSHQDQTRSYKEVCAPVIERCLFLFNELRPATGDEINTFTRSKLLRSIPRWREVISKIVEDKKKSKRECVCGPKCVLRG